MKVKPLSILLPLLFLFSGGAKLAGLEFEVMAFERWGYSLWFMYFVGAVEVAGGIGLLLGRLSVLAGVCLAVMMIGAIITHILHAEWGMLIAAMVIFTLLVAYTVTRRTEIIAPSLQKPQF